MAAYFNALPTAPPPIRPPCQLFGWGSGETGALAMGPVPLAEFSTPRRNPWVEGKISEGVFGQDNGSMEAIAAGGMHTLLIDERGTVRSCGVNDDAALGRATESVPNPAQEGSYLDEGELESYPHPVQTLQENNFRAVKVAAGDCISAAVSSDGELYIWGTFKASEGTLGFSEKARHQQVPQRIQLGPTTTRTQANPEKAVAIAAGNNHLLILSTHGSVYSCGAGESGELGHKIPSRLKLHGTKVYKIALGRRANRARCVGAGKSCSFAVDENGDVWGWGLNCFGQTGTGISSPKTLSDEIHIPTKVPKLSAEALNGDVVVQIAGGAHHTLFLTSQGKVYACGRCDGGELGLSDDNEEFAQRRDPRFLDQPLQVSIPEQDEDPIVQISAGIENSMAVTRDGALYAWGQETNGELGVKGVNAKTPTVVVRRTGGSWQAKAVACGGHHSLGLFRRKAD